VEKMAVMAMSSPLEGERGFLAAGQIWVHRARGAFAARALRQAWALTRWVLLVLICGLAAAAVFVEALVALAARVSS
jgi:hypothetical protein